MFKPILALALTLLTASAFAANIECAFMTNKKGKATKKLVPVSVDAKRLADHIGVKTCDGDRFAEQAAGNGGIKATRSVTKEERKAYLLDGDALKF